MRVSEKHSELTKFSNMKVLTIFKLGVFLTVFTLIKIINLFDNIFQIFNILRILFKFLKFLYLMNLLNKKLRFFFGKTTLNFSYIKIVF